MLPLLIQKQVAIAQVRRTREDSPTGIHFGERCVTQTERKRWLSVSAFKIGRAKLIVYEDYSLLAEALTTPSVIHSAGFGRLLGQSHPSTTTNGRSLQPRTGEVPLGLHSAAGSPGHDRMLAAAVSPRASGLLPRGRLYALD